MRSPIKLRSIARHGDTLPEDIPAGANARTEMFGAVKVAPLDDTSPAMPGEETRAFKAYVVPFKPPFTSEARFDRDALASMRLDMREGWDGLPIFQSLIGDKFALHQLAMRAPHNASGGNR